MVSEDWKHTRRDLVAQWGIEAPDLDPDLDPYEILLQALEERIYDLLLNNFQKLTSAVYILDISERRFAQAMEQPTQLDRAHDLALAVMERETEKIKMRQKYAQKSRLRGGGELSAPEKDR